MVLYETITPKRIETSFFTYIFIFSLCIKTLQNTKTLENLRLMSFPRLINVIPRLINVIPRLINVIPAPD